MESELRARAEGWTDALRVRRAPYTCLSLSKKSLRAGMRDDMKCSSPLNNLLQVLNVPRPPHPVALRVAQFLFQLERGRALHSVSAVARARPAPKFYFSAPHPTLRSSILARALISFSVFCGIRLIAWQQQTAAMANGGGKGGGMGDLVFVISGLFPFAFPTPLSLPRSPLLCSIGAATAGGSVRE